MTRKIIIILGGTFGLYHGKGLFREIEKNFKCILRRISANKLTSTGGNLNFEIYICNGPVRDKNYYFQKKYLESVWKEVMPLPAAEIVKKIVKPNLVLFFGYCGTFKGKKSVYTPEIFKEVFFEKNKLLEIKEHNIKVKNYIKIRNILSREIKADKARVITSNMTLAPVHEIPETKDKIIAISKVLSMYGDVVEKETYQVVKHFKGKCPIGIYLQSSDVLMNKRHMLSERMETDKNKFNTNCIKSIKTAIKMLK